MPDYKTRDDLARELRLSQAKQKDAEAKLAKVQQESINPSVITLEDLKRVLLGAGDAPLDPLELLARLGVKVPSSFSVTVNFTVTGKGVRLLEGDVANWELDDDGRLIPNSDRAILVQDMEFTDFNVVVVNPIDSPQEAPEPAVQPPKPIPAPVQAPVVSKPPEASYPARPKSVGEQWRDIEEGK